MSRIASERSRINSSSDFKCSSFPAATSPRPVAEEVLGDLQKVFETFALAARQRAFVVRGWRRMPTAGVAVLGCQNGQCVRQWRLLLARDGSFGCPFRVRE